jgi:hypothetical protein
LSEFDIIFVDADHNFSQILRDFNNSFQICRKYLFLHDLLPSKEEHTIPSKCGDAFKLLYYLVKQEGLNDKIRTLNADCGLTVLTMPLRFELAPPSKSIFSMTYSDFMEQTKSYQLFSVDQVVASLEEAW